MSGEVCGAFSSGLRRDIVRLDSFCTFDSLRYEVSFSNFREVWARGFGAGGAALDEFEEEELNSRKPLELNCSGGEESGFSCEFLPFTRRVRGLYSPFSLDLLAMRVSSDASENSIIY